MSMERRIEGTTESCLDHFLYHAKLERVSALAASIKVGSGTIRRWKTKKIRPIGENLLAVRYFLASEGYRVTELERLSPEIRELGKVITGGKVSFDEVVKDLDYTHRQELLRVLLGKGGMIKSRIEKMRKLIDRFKPQKPAAPAPSFEGGLSRHVKDAPIKAFALLSVSLMPLAEALASDEFSSEDRKKARSMVQNGEGVFKLARLFNQLCSETARNHVRSTNE